MDLRFKEVNAIDLKIGDRVFRTKTLLRNGKLISLKNIYIGEVTKNVAYGDRRRIIKIENSIKPHYWGNHFKVLIESK